MSHQSIPKQLYVVTVDRVEYQFPDPDDYSIRTEEHHTLGFLHPHQPQLRADAKRKDTQHYWAGIQLQNDQFMRSQYTGSGRYYQLVPIDPKHEPKIWENEPLDGFVLIDTVNRYRGNKLFKVMDPRGIEFEITVQSLYHILCEGTVSNGKIIDKCVWKANKNLIIAS